MAEYIEREAATQAVMAAKWEIGSDGAMAMQIVASAPAADVAPVVHGRWVDNDGGFWEVCSCSVCGKRHPTTGETPNYCPNCGAKMDKVAPDEE